MFNLSSLWFWILNITSCIKYSLNYFLKIPKHLVVKYRNKKLKVTMKKLCFHILCIQLNLKMYI